MDAARGLARDEQDVVSQHGVRSVAALHGRWRIEARGRKARRRHGPFYGELERILSHPAQVARWEKLIAEK